MGIFRSIVVLLVGAALATFLWSNYEQRVVICLFRDRFCTIELSLSAALVGAMTVGFVLAVVLSLPNQFRLRRRVKELNKQNERLAQEIAELRKLPLSDVPEPDGPEESGDDDKSPGGSFS